MNTKFKSTYFWLLFFVFDSIQGQNVSLYEQFNGRYDFTFVGNTLNPIENTFQPIPSILDSSSENLFLNSNDVIEKAYLYWAGCGPGDFEVKLNNVSIQAERTFSTIYVSNYSFFSAFADVTSLVQEFGNGTYTFSELDINDSLGYYHQIDTNFAGWAIVIIYKNEDLPLNQLNIYDGLQNVSFYQNSLTITLNALNVIDNQNAKIGFLAWEGDAGLANNETLRINNEIVSNLPLNPATNAFNGTNSISGNSQLYNMDLDIYPIENFIEVGDTQATIQLTSNQDFVMVNAIISKLNSQLPDASVQINSFQQNCNSRLLTIDFTVFNNDATAALPINTPISFYANQNILETINIPEELAINDSWTSQITLTIPENISSPFNFEITVDDSGNGLGQVIEINENNNFFSQQITIGTNPIFEALEPIENCNKGLNRNEFDFSNYSFLVTQELDIQISYYENIEDAILNQNPIINTTNYSPTELPKEIFIRLENNTNCVSITSFQLKTKNCPPIIYNYVSANNDNFNDVFFIDGLKDIFTNYELLVYNRWGNLIWKGTNETPFWDGSFNNQLAPEGTYFYVLFLNDENYPKPLSGYLQITR